MGTTIPQKVVGSANAEREARKAGFRDYDQMRAFVLAKQRGNNGAVMIKGASAPIGAPIAVRPAAPVPVQNAMADNGIFGLLNRKYREATGGK